MVNLGQQLVSRRHQVVGLGLQHSSAALLNLAGTVGKPCEERIQAYDNRWNRKPE